MNEINLELLNLRDTTLVAKLSLWSSQKEIILSIFQWAENSDFIWQWFETKYDNNDKKLSTEEISFIFYLNKIDEVRLKDNFPKELFPKVRFEPFNSDIFMYYYNDKKFPVKKHENVD
tara:strand:- start:12839 stop:13192 length:354 start_codon:yes stop_codon:yes gene_type:complete